MRQNDRYIIINTLDTNKIKKKSAATSKIAAEYHSALHKRSRPQKIPFGSASFALKRRSLGYHNMKNFAAIDFETANGCRSSVCSVGVVIVKDNKIADRFYSLIHPVPDYYSYWNTQVHGLTAESTMTASSFPEVWEKASAAHRGPAARRPQQPFRRGLSESCFRCIRNDLSGL